MYDSQIKILNWNSILYLKLGICIATQIVSILKHQQNFNKLMEDTV